MQQKLTVVPQGGLCNRLRLLFSIMEAEAFGARNISIHWAKNAECRAWFEELFETIPTMYLSAHKKILYESYKLPKNEKAREYARGVCFP